MSPASPFATLRASFKAKVFGLTLLFVISLSILYPAVFIPYEIDDNHDALVREGIVLTNLFAFNARLPLYSENLALIDEVADSMLIHEDILSVAVFTADGRKLIEELTGEQHVPPSDNPEERREVAARAATLTKVTYEHRPEGILFWAPVRIAPGNLSDDELYAGERLTTQPEQTIGVVRLLLNTAELRETKQYLIAVSCAIALLFIILGTLLAYVVARSVTAPLKRLATNVAALGQQDTLGDVAVETGDEVGQVATAFNGLVESLRRRESEKEFLEEQLRHSQKLEAMGTLAGGIAHDFNTILTAITGFAELAQKEAKDRAAVENYLIQLRASADKGSNLISRLLAFSRKQEINPRAADLNAVIRNIEEILRRVVRDAVALELDLDPEPILVLVDTGQFDQVLLNLTVNARDAMPDGGTLRIATRRVASCATPCGGVTQVPPSGWCAVVTVTDTGAGLPDEIREKIFDPFFTTKEVGKGTGLGLSMAYGIIRQHAGTIQAQGHEGVGTTFTVCLPGLASCPAGEEPGIQGIRIVVADPDPVTRRRIEFALRTCGAAVNETGDAAAAVRLGSNPAEPVDVVIINILMQDARNAYEEIRRISPRVRFIFIGGMRREGLTDSDALDAGITTIYRPIDEAELMAKLMKVLGREAADAGSA